VATGITGQINNQINRQQAVMMSGVAPKNPEEKTGRVDAPAFEDHLKSEKSGGILEGIQNLLVGKTDKDAQQTKVTSAKVAKPQPQKVAFEEAGQTEESKIYLPEHLRLNSADPEKMPAKIRDNATLINLQYQMSQNQGAKNPPAMFGFMNKLYKMLDLEYQQHAKTDGALYTRKELREVMQAIAPMVVGQFKTEEKKTGSKFSSFLFEKVGKLQESLNDLLPISFSFSTVK